MVEKIRSGDFTQETPDPDEDSAAIKHFNKLLLLITAELYKEDPEFQLVTIKESIEVSRDILQSSELELEALIKHLKKFSSTLQLRVL